MQSEDSKNRFLVWLLPLTYALHIMEEYFGGEGLPIWLSEFINADISDFDFIVINAIALSIVILFSLYHSFIKQNNMLFLALTTLFFVNGLLHLFLSIFTFTYSPGTITGVLLYLPMGIYFFKLLRPKLTERKRSSGIMMGILLHIVVVIVARYI